MGEKRKQKAIDRALELVKQGKSYREAARIAGVDRSTVTRWANREKVKSKFTTKFTATTAGTEVKYEQPTTTSVIEPKPSLTQRIKQFFGF